MNKALIIIYISIFINCLYVSYKHGKPREGRFNIFAYLVNVMITLALIWWALGWKFI